MNMPMVRMLTGRDRETEIQALEILAEGEQPKEAERALGCTWRALGQDGEKYVKENGTDKLFFCLFGEKS